MLVKMLIVLGGVSNAASAASLDIENTLCCTGIELNSFDKNSLFVAKEFIKKGEACVVDAVCCGPQACEEVLCDSFLYGVQDAIFIKMTYLLDFFSYCTVLYNFISNNDYDIIFVSSQSWCINYNFFGQYVAGMLNFPYVTDVENLKIDNDEVYITVTSRFSAFSMRCNSFVKKPFFVSLLVNKENDDCISISERIAASKKQVTIRNVDDFGVKDAATTGVKFLPRKNKRLKKHIYSTGDIIELLKV